MEITKAEAITLLAAHYDKQRQTIDEVTETDAQLVTRRRNTMRERYKGTRHS